MTFKYLSQTKKPKKGFFHPIRQNLPLSQIEPRTIVEELFLQEKRLFVEFGIELFKLFPVEKLVD